MVVNRQPHHGLSRRERPSKFTPKSVSHAMFREPPKKQQEHLHLGLYGPLLACYSTTVQQLQLVYMKCKRKHLNKPQNNSWNNFLWKTNHSTSAETPHAVNTGVEGWWFGLVYTHMTWSPCSELWTPFYSKVLIAAWQLKPGQNWVMQQDSDLNLQQNGWKSKEWKCWNAPVEVQTSATEMLQWGLQRAVHKRMSANWLLKNPNSVLCVAWRASVCLGPWCRY